MSGAERGAGLSDQSNERLAARGLATVAMLKVNFDSGRDHLSMFEPFVVDTICASTGDVVNIEATRENVSRRHQLLLPLHTLRTLLERAKKAGYLSRDGGQYFRTEKTREQRDLVALRSEVEERQSQLARAFIGFASTRGMDVRLVEQALGFILDFFERYQVSLVLGESMDPEVTIPEDPSEDQGADFTTKVTAAFLLDTLSTGGDLADIIQETLEGFVLQNTLLLSDVRSATRQFSHLRVFLDTFLVFGALGLRGPQEELAIREFITLLHDTGASTEIFETTLDEMTRILAVYERNVGTQSGRDSLRPSDITRYILTKKFTPSDIRMEIGLLKRKLRSLDIQIRSLPLHSPSTTLDEASLAKELSPEPGEESSDRVKHDVDCVAGILSLRSILESDQMDHVGSVFVTSSGKTNRSVSKWFHDEGGKGVPPMVHYLFLSNLAWIKRPSSASKLKVHELVALCAAALRPSRRKWDTFVREVKILKDSGEITSDEVAVVIASSLTDDLLSEPTSDDDPDAASVLEVVERVRQSLNTKAATEVRDARAAQNQSEEQRRQLELKIDERTRVIGKCASWLVVTFLGLILAASVVLSMVGGGLVVGIVVVIFLAVVGFLGTVTGFNLKSWRPLIEKRVRTRVREWLLRDGEAKSD